MPLMDILILLIFPVCGALACGLFVGDTVAECEKKYQLYGAITAKDARLVFKSMFISALITKAILGVYAFPAAVVYKLWMKEDFNFRFSLPKDFWTKYFREEEQP
ncbi:MAG: hypothetical protein UW30_C0005G0033 [Candidatus Giovannonibacteria bacterium GW2011_GWA2_44_13b]|uniref:Uncharacterized protein n=2 Tax=Candidatus Giovannoniibacteriota TaxID=1752738 RepID=A0A0G1K1Q4_9BACT|nr:MAG: hypothetical protein UW30_C0005G0033 [Candidatus Giovannonibacteria bacterium GW2011_GWA2_44_13b]